MQIGSSTVALASAARPSGTGVYLERIKQQLAIVNDGSADLRSRGDAYQSLMGMSLDDGFWSNSTEEERTLRGTLFDSALFKQIDTAANKFSNEGMALGRARTVGANMFDRLNELPADQQYLIYLGTTDLEQVRKTPTLESWKVVLEDWKVKGAAIDAADAAAKEKPAVSVNLSDEAKALLDTTEAKKALETLSSDAPVNTLAAMVLQTLQDAAQAREDREADAAKAADKLYTPGANTDLSV